MCVNVLYWSGIVVMDFVLFSNLATILEGTYYIFPFPLTPVKLIGDDQTITIAIFFLAFAPVLMALLPRFHQYNGAAMHIAPL
jgi:hypothetical protein